MSRAKLNNSDLEFYTVSGSDTTTKVKLVPTNDTLTLQGQTAGTKVTLTNLADPTADVHCATKKYVDEQLSSKVQGLRWKEPCRAKTTAPLAGVFANNAITMSANGAAVVDGQTLALNDRVLVANQTSPSENGIYFVSTAGEVGGRGLGDATPAILTRATDADTATELEACAVFISQGTANSDTAFIQTEDNITLNTSDITFQQFSSAGEFVGGDGIAKVGNTFSADIDNISIEISGGKIAIKTGGVGTDALGANVVTNAEIQDATILAAQLADDACETRVIKNANVTSAKIASNAVNTSHLSTGCVDSDAIGADQVTSTKIAADAIQTSHLSTGCVDSDAIGASQVTSASIAQNAVLTTHIGAGQVQTGNILDSSVTALKLGANAVTSSKIAANNVLEAAFGAGAVSTRALADSSISAAKMRADSVTTTAVADSSITETKLASNSVTTSKIGTLSSLNVNGLVTATGFLASGSGTESDGGFALPKAKSVSIDFDTDQTITGDGNFVTVGGAVSEAGVNFTYDDNITMGVAMSALRIFHQGTSNTTVIVTYEVSYYDGAQQQQAFSTLEYTATDAQMFASTAGGEHLFNHQAIVGDGSSRIASVRLRIKHTESADTLRITDSLQTTILAVDDTSGNINRTYTNGTLT